MGCVGRIPAERDTTYKKIKRFDVEPVEKEALDEFQKDLNRTKYVVGHNIEFDINI